VDDDMMLLAVVASIVCAVCASVAVWWMKKKGTDADREAEAAAARWEAEAARYEPMIEALGDRLETQVAGKTVGEAMAIATRLQPGIKTLMLFDDETFWLSNRGWAVVFDATAPSEKVSIFMIGYDRVSIGYALPQS
jgi:hypothetical protein